MRKLTILVDMDDTIENLCTAWVEWLNINHGTSVLPTDIVEWNICKAFPTLTPSQVYAPLYTEDFWHTVKPIEGAAEALFKLKNEGHRIVIVTASDTDTVTYKMNHVLYKYFPFLTYKDVVITSQKDLIDGDVMIDDNPMNFDHENPTRKLNILFTAPHNANFDDEKAGLYRADAWEEVLFYIHFYSYLKESV